MKIHHQLTLIVLVSLMFLGSLGISLKALDTKINVLLAQKLLNVAESILE